MKLSDILFEGETEQLVLLNNFLKRWIIGDGTHTTTGRAGGVSQAILGAARRYFPGCIYNGKAYRAVAVKMKDVDKLGNPNAMVRGWKPTTGFSVQSWAKTMDGVYQFTSQMHYTNQSNSVFIVMQQQVSQGIDLLQLYRGLRKKGHDIMDGEHWGYHGDPEAGYDPDEDDYEADDGNSIIHMLHHQEEIISPMNSSAQCIGFLGSDKDNHHRMYPSLQAAIIAQQAAAEEQNNGYEPEDDDW